MLMTSGSNAAKTPKTFLVLNDHEETVFPMHGQLHLDCNLPVNKFFLIDDAAG